MSRYLRKSLPCALILTLGVGLAAAPGFAAGRAEHLYELETGDLPAFHGAEAAWRVRVDTELLAQAPSRLHLETPDGLEFDARRLGFERRGPGSLTWRGRLTDSRESRAILSMEGGVLSGWVHTPFGEYEIRPLADGGSAVLRMSNQPLGACEADRSLLPAELPTTTSPLQARAAPRVASDSASSIALLALYTAEARDAMGGPAQIKSRVRLMVDLANEAFGNSRMNTRLTLAHIGLAPIQERASMADNLDPLRESPQVRAQRDAHSADLVALIQSSDPETCGIAYIMHDISPAFAPYAYSVTAYSCVTTLAHEVGHNLGMEHDPANGSPVAQALFPWAFGHFVRNNWRTVMSYPDPCGDCTRVPHFSNPNVLYDGQATGIEGERDNARVGNRTGIAIANFRLSGVLLADDFESGSPTGWQWNRGNMTTLQPGLEGGYLLDVALSNLAARRFLMHQVPAPGQAVNVEFLLNANRVELDGAEVDILVLFGNGQPHTKLVLKENGQSYRVSLVTKGNTGGYVEVASTPVRATKNELIGIEWRSASSPMLADGQLRLVKNGGGRGVLRDFANDRWGVRQVRIGLPHGAAGTSGRGGFYIDNYAATVPLD